MPANLDSYFGIDFGTTSSAVVGYMVLDHRPEQFLYGDDEGRPIPSVVAIDKTTGEVITGREGWDKKMELSESCVYISSVKTILDHDTKISIAGREWTPVDVAAELFKSLKAAVKDRTGTEMTQATVAIPIGFSPEKRDKLREAAKKAGISISSYISEPTAAFFANYDELRSSSIVAVFDWGGGTLDVSVLRNENGKISELATVGSDIAGDFIDSKLAQRLHAKIARKKGIEIAFNDMPSSAQDIMRVRSERAKRALGDDDTATISINNYGPYGACRELLDYDWFADIIDPEVNMAMDCLKKAIDQSGVGLANIDRIVMVGGSSNLRPLIEKKMKDSQKFRNVDTNPIKDTSKVLISTRYVRKGYSLGVKFGKTGKRLIPGIITGQGSGNTYPVSISLNYKDLLKNKIYNIDYRLVKEVSEIVYNNILSERTPRLVCIRLDAWCYRLPL